MVTFLLAILIAVIVLVRYERTDTAIGPMMQVLALAVVGRFLFVSLPNVQPSTALLMLTAVYIGFSHASILALFLPLVSGLLLGIGPFVLYQFLGWFVVVALTASCRPLLRRSRVSLALFGLIGGFVYGWISNLAFLEVIGTDFIRLLVLSAPFDLAHGLSNAFFVWVLHDLFIRLFGSPDGYIIHKT